MTVEAGDLNARYFFEPKEWTVRIGFSGTRQGMTNEQLLQVHMLLGDLQTAGATQANHGMCVGADEQFHFMAKGLGYFLTGFPGVTNDGTQFQRACLQCDVTLPERPFLIRNRDIVAESDVMIVTPKSSQEEFRGSGSWASIRYARQANCQLIIVWPDGTGVVEHRGEPVQTLDGFRQSLTATT